MKITNELLDAMADPRPNDAWNGGRSLSLGFSSPGFGDEDAVFRCFWLPVQSLSITAGQSYETIIVFKLDSIQVDLDLSLSVEALSEARGQVVIINNTINTEGLPGGWKRLATHFFLSVDLSDSTVTSIDTLAAIGLVDFALERPTQPFSFSIVFGQLTISPTPRQKLSLTPLASSGLISSHLLPISNDEEHQNS